jgi:pimeloyl-ACP methyl ester carboxylesterase
MVFEYKNCKIFYRFFDRKTEVVSVFLHGWGCDQSGLIFCKDLTKSSCLFVDFPPFGKSGSVDDQWNIFTYANLLLSLFSKLGIKKFNLIGHSFGGRIAIILSVLCKNETQNLVLIDSAGLKPRRSLSYYIKICRYKFRKFFHLNTEKFGSRDYLALDKNLRRLFINIIETHLDEFLPCIKCNTLIIFGENDKTTPIYMARRFHKKIKNSKLEIISNCGHFPFVERKLVFSEILQNFLT